ncbi:NAD(P)/FAD-dependent oxidoreductase [Microlunatus parietis]|uniref:NADH dehydrogenase FAD-containing subunit n=1 Tax=Microlunatus parietis TaxID=682979 RepID=A0A7Y9IEE3_9ACTN|nr:FAD-dependent oxidoreductase [Microlunatus parietis]NYE75294.1 NADH dehydrogenase FAD-containing subunit [Microlunatus parietis]
MTSDRSGKLNHRIVVLGAGYAGVLAAGRLARQLGDGVEIVLVNADGDFVERVRLHQLAAGQDLRPRPLRELFAGSTVAVRQAVVDGLDVDRRTVRLREDAGAAEIGYDTLVYALGSTAADHGIPGVTEHAQTLAGRAGALRLRDRLRELPAGASVAVIGGGLTGLEAITEIAESRPDLKPALITREPLGDRLGDRARRHLGRVLNRLGVAVSDQREVLRVEDGAVITHRGAVPAAVTVWAAGFGVQPIAAAAALEVTGGGRIVVDETMRSVSHPDVYAVGDAGSAAGVNGTTLRMSCASGLPMALRATSAIIARLTGRPVRPHPISYYLRCISLGRRDGIIQPVTRDDRALAAAITGPAAARIKEFVCAGAAWFATHPVVLRRAGSVLLPGRDRQQAA